MSLWGSIPALQRTAGAALFAQQGLRGVFCEGRAAFSAARRKRRSPPPRRGLAAPSDMCAFLPKAVGHKSSFKALLRRELEARRRRPSRLHSRPFESAGDSVDTQDALEASAEAQEEGASALPADAISPVAFAHASPWTQLQVALRLRQKEQQGSTLQKDEPSSLRRRRASEGLLRLSAGDETLRNPSAVHSFGDEANCKDAQVARCTAQAPAASEASTQGVVKKASLSLQEESLKQHDAALQRRKNAVARRLWRHLKSRRLRNLDALLVELA